MTTARTDQQAVAPAELPHLRFIGEAQVGAALQQGDPLPLLLVVPEPLRTAGLAGMDPLQAPVGPLRKQRTLLLPWLRAGSGQQVAISAAGRFHLPPAAADLKAV
jgi:hypothetical protein